MRLPGFGDLLSGRVAGSKPAPAKVRQRSIRTGGLGGAPLVEGETGVSRRNWTQSNLAGRTEAEAEENRDMLDSVGHVHTARAFLRAAGGGMSGAFRQLAQTVLRDEPPKEDVSGLGHLAMRDHDANAPATKRGHLREAFPNRKPKRNKRQRGDDRGGLGGGNRGTSGREGSGAIDSSSRGTGPF